MFHTITIPANLYPAILQSTVDHFEDAHPDRRWTREERSDDKLRAMQQSWVQLGEVVAVLDQLSWSDIPREIRITAEGPLIRSILANAINNALMAFTRALGATITPTCDLDQFQLLNNQIAGLLALTRAVQHDHDNATGDTA